MNSINYTLTQKALAMGVHLFTSTGVIAAFMAIRAISEVQVNWQREAMLWLILALFIDGVDGAMARAVKAKEVLPGWDGKSIDYVIDFLTYAVIPAFFFYQSDLLPEGWKLIAVFAILLTSAMYYGKMGMVSHDLYFVGFPVMWNMVVYVMFFVLDLSVWLNLAFIFFFCIMHFVPLKYVYPSRTLHFRKLNIFNTVLFFIFNGIILYLYPEKNNWVTGVAILTILYFGWMTIYGSFMVEEEETAKS